MHCSLQAVVVHCPGCKERQSFKGPSTIFGMPSEFHCFHDLEPMSRGSLEIGDVLSDLTAKPLEMFGMLGTEGLVHEGLMSAAT